MPFVKVDCKTNEVCKTSKTRNLKHSVKLDKFFQINIIYVFFVLCFPFCLVSISFFVIMTYQGDKRRSGWVLEKTV